METRLFGFDFGNSETCSVAFIDGVGVARRIPSYTAVGSLDRLHSFGSKLGSGDYVYKDADTEVFVGKLALEQSRTPYSTFGDVFRYRGEQAQQLLLTSADSLIEDKEYSLRVITGLPISTYVGNKNLRSEVVKMLSDTFIHWFNGEKRIAHIQIERVMMEGQAVMADLRVPAESLNAVIDCGGRTTDIYASRGQEPLVNLCQHKPIGVEHAISRFGALFETRYGRPLTPYEKRAILHSHIHRTGDAPIVKVDGKTADATIDLLEQALEEVGMQIYTFVVDTLNDSETGKVASSFDRVILVGGGFYYFNDILSSRMRNLESVDHPEMANAWGYVRTLEKIVARQQLTA
jgi:plasmid segregation protein ParM